MYGPSASELTINVNGSTTLTDSTISGNSAGFNGGGISNRGTVDVTSSTISGNSADFGGGIYNDYAATLSHTIVAGNRRPGSLDDVSGDPVEPTSAYNLIGDVSTSGGLTDGTNGNIVGVDWTTVLENDGTDPVVANNGGPTQTIALLPGSLAINAGDPAVAMPPDFDQRGAGFPHVVGGVIDVGAVEANPAVVRTLGSIPVGMSTQPDYVLRAEEAVFYRFELAADVLAAYQPTPRATSTLRIYRR